MLDNRNAMKCTEAMTWVVGSCVNLLDNVSQVGQYSIRLRTSWRSALRTVSISGLQYVQFTVPMTNVRARWRDLRTVSNLIAFYMPLLNDDNLKRSSKKPGSAALCIFLNLGLCHVISDIIIIIIIIIKNVKIKVTLCELTLQGHFTYSTLHSQKTKPVNFQHSWQAPTGSDTSYMAFVLPDF